MRIIAGEFRGRKLLEPEFDTTRPITDRVKQSLFDIVTPFVQGMRVYDCFAGTGSMGLESISRGAEHATFFERDRSAVHRLRQNITSLECEQRCEVVADDIFKWFARNLKTDDRAGVVFFDPPYKFLNTHAQELQQLAATVARGHLAYDGIFVFRHDAKDRLELPELVRYDEREYGGMTIEFLRKANA